MGTRAQLGVRCPDGTVVGCFIQYDGYPDHMLPAIEDYLAKYTSTGLITLIHEAQHHGGMKTFNAPPHRETCFLALGGKLCIIDENNWTDDCHDTQYRYLVNYKTSKTTVTNNYDLGGVK